MKLIYLLAGLRLAAGYKTYSESDLETFTTYNPSLDLLNIQNGALLTPLLVPRVSGTQGATDVFNWMHEYLSKNLSGWTVEEDRFTERTPLADVEFVNLIATMDPPNAKDADVGRIVLSAHYDSKRLPAGFIGASDSSVPCAILLYIATMLSDRLPFWFEDEYWDASNDDLEVPTPRGVQLIFFDGEEAVDEWTDQDSIYGARHLAGKWESERLLPSASASRHNKIQSIDLFVLLDLLGCDSTSVPSFFPTTHWAYEKLLAIQDSLSANDLLKPHTGMTFAANGREFQWAGQVGDDHVPFMQRGVEILHAIAMPFPGMWHTMDDNADHLHQGSIDNLAMIFSAFVAEYMDIPAKTVLEPTQKRRVDEL